IRVFEVAEKEKASHRADAARRNPLSPEIRRVVVPAPRQGLPLPVDYHLGLFSIGAEDAPLAQAYSERSRGDISRILIAADRGDLVLRKICLRSRRLTSEHRAALREVELLQSK